MRARVVAERGQASIEVLAGIPALALAGLVALQLLATGYSLTLADGAAEAGAMALAAGRPATPRSARRCRAGRATGSTSTSTVGELTVRLRPPSPLAAVCPRARGQLLGMGQATRRRMSAPAPRTVSAALRMPGGGSLLVTDLGGASGGLAVAAAVGAALASAERRVLLAEIGAERSRGPTTLASSSARALEQELRELGIPSGRPHAAGSAGSGFPRRTSPSASSHVQSRRRIRRSRSSTSPPGCGASPWTSRRCLYGAGLLRADLAEDRPLMALAVIELRERRLPVRVASRPLGLVASRRALAGLEVGGGVRAAGLAARPRPRCPPPRGSPRSEARRFR